MKYKGKVYYCTDDKLFNGSKKSGHYVLVSDDIGSKAIVRIITSLEKKPYSYDVKKISHVRNGHVKPIPVNETYLTKWSGINKKTIIVDKKDLVSTKIKISRNNFFFK